MIVYIIRYHNYFLALIHFQHIVRRCKFLMLKKLTSLLKKIVPIYLNYIIPIVSNVLLVYHLIKIGKFKINLLLISLLIYFSILIITKKICKIRINNMLDKLFKSSWTSFIIIFIILYTVDYFVNKPSSIIYFNSAIGYYNFFK